jgi:anti-anti-sigma regulatory factor
MTGVYAVRGDEPIFVVEKLSDVLIFRLIADPALSNYRSKQFEYNRMMKMLGEPDVNHLLFDFAECVNVDSVTMGIVIALTLRLGESGGGVAMCCCKDEVREAVTCLNAQEPFGRRAAWTHYPSRRHAIEALRSEVN